jgi:putative nucleotidyltransferase with HDIG domain
MWNKWLGRTAAAKKEPEPAKIVAFTDMRPLAERVRDVGKKVLSDVSSGKVKLPMLPAIATQALGLAGNPDASFREINRVIGGDAVMSAKVIAAANSAIYNSGTPVATLLAAINRLGMGTLRDILYQAVAEAHFFHGLRGDVVTQQREHAIEVAHASRIIANTIRLNADYPFLCGLLHDIGRTFLVGYFDRLPPAELRESELPEVVTAFHAILGGQVAKIWKLPEAVSLAAATHHRYRDEKLTGGYSQIGNVVAAAQRILRRSVDAPFGPEDQALIDLGIQESQLANLLAQIERLRQSKAA